MSTRVALLLLSIFLLADLAVGVRLPKKQTSSSEESDESAEDGRQKLLDDVLQNYLEVEDFSLEKSRDILKKVLKEDTIKNVNSDAMIENKSILNDYVKKANEARKQKPPADASSMNYFPYVVGKSIVYQEFEAITLRHNTTALSSRKPTTEDFLVENAMKKNGLENFQEDLAKRRSEFEVDFLKSVGDYMNSLKPAEKEKNKDLVDWYNKYNGVTDPVKKEGMFSEFLGLYYKQPQ